MSSNWRAVVWVRNIGRYLLMVQRVHGEGERWAWRVVGPMAERDGFAKSKPLAMRAAEEVVAKL